VTPPDTPSAPLFFPRQQDGFFDGPAEGLRVKMFSTVDKIRVEFEGQWHPLAPGTSVNEFLGKLYIAEHQIVGATLNHHLVSLETTIDGDSHLAAVNCGSREGQAIVRRTATYAFHSVVRELFPSCRLLVGQSLLGGYYYDLMGHEMGLQAWCEQVNRGLLELADRDLTFERRSVSLEAVETCIEDPFQFKKKLLRGWPAPQVKVLSMGNYSQIMHGPCAPSTCCIRGTRVEPYEQGVILFFPGAAATSPLPVADSQGTKIFRIYRETREWNQLVGVAAVGDLTSAALEDRFDEVVRMAEALHEKKISEIANEIASRRDQLRLVCIAGPSASGKTTFVQRLSVHLRVLGLQPVPVSLDDFYAGVERTPRDPDGELDFEALEALDLELLDKTLGRLLAGEEVRMPRYDFARGRPFDEHTWRPLALHSQQVVLIEGIHGLNPALVPSLSRDRRYHVFVSALTQLVIDEHNRIFTSDLRLLRRIVRDRLYRGFSAADTIERWPSVRRGEEANIFPYQEYSDAMFNSTLVYETSILRTLAWRFLLEVPRGHPSRVRAYELLKFLELFIPVISQSIPANSVLREFIGGSDFQR